MKNELYFNQLPVDVKEHVLQKAIEQNPSAMPALYRVDRWFRQNTLICIHKNPDLAVKIPFSVLSESEFWRERVTDSTLETPRILQGTLSGILIKNRSK